MREYKWINGRKCWWCMTDEGVKYLPREYFSQPPAPPHPRECLICYQKFPSTSQAVKHCIAAHGARGRRHACAQMLGEVQERQFYDHI